MLAPSSPIARTIRAERGSRRLMTRSASPRSVGSGPASAGSTAAKSSIGSVTRRPRARKASMTL